MASKSQNFIKINNLMFSTKKEACDFYGLKYMTIYQRAKRHNLTFEQMLEHILNHSPSFVDNGIIIETQADISRMFHISTNSINRYMKKHNLTLEEAYHHYKTRELAKNNNVHQFRQSFKIKNQIFYSKLDVYNYFCISDSTIRYIMKKSNLSFEQAVEQYLNKSKFSFAIDKTIFHNQQDLANYFHISRQAISHHMKLYHHDLKQTFQWYKEKQNA